ncbi:nuclear transport factor 2 family protein [Kribbella sp. NPDC023972]|uniref:nuclear transport factor 2 family protein n=1 Tax=Kribbella sp. NPDC023972 TaxID=3154795 RepID=UPI0034051E0F
MSATITESLVTSFVEATNTHEAEALTGLFGPESVVIDDSTEYRGATQIAQWIQDHQIAPKITLTVVDYDPSGPTLTANANGDFPGGPLPFSFRFTLTDVIERLEVTPA